LRGDCNLGVKKELTSKWWGEEDIEEALLFATVCLGSRGGLSALFPARGGESKSPRISSTFEMFPERCGGDAKIKRRGRW
jgi:hypothetical protein